MLLNSFSVKIFAKENIGYRLFKCLTFKGKVTFLMQQPPMIRKAYLFKILFLLLSVPVSLYAQDTKAFALKGEGIYSILRRHGLDPSVHMDKFIELNKTLLGAENVLIEGQHYLLPAALTKTEAVAAAVSDKAEVLRIPIFGKKYEELRVRNKTLEGAVYYLLAGHGGPDPGAMSEYGAYYLSEDEYAYDVTLRLARRLMEFGAEVYMIIQDPDDGIRDDAILGLDADEVCYPGAPIPAGQKDRLKQRTDAVNRLFAKYAGAYQRLIAIHIDSRKLGENIDVFFYHHHRSKAGEQLATHIHETFRTKYAIHQPARKYEGSVTSRSSLYIIRNTHPPTVFIELGNIKNTQDQRRFVLNDNRQALANWITEGVLQDFKNKKR